MDSTPTPTVPPTLAATRRVIGRTLSASAYLLLTLPVAIVSFTVLVTGLSLGLGLAIIWIGLPIGAATLYAGRYFARFERTRLRLLGTRIDDAKPSVRTGSAWRRMLRTFDVNLWRETLHGIVALPLACVTWSLTILWWALALGGLTGWIWEPINARFGDGGATGLMSLLGWPIPGAVFDVLVGLFALVTLPWVVRGLAAAHAGLGRALLSPTRGSLERRVAELAQARDQLTAAEVEVLRRIERDLHDGPQQTLIRLGMDLAAAERRLAEGDAAATTTLLAGCRRMTDDVIASLRNLSRSIAPPVLAERGLQAALAAAAATCPVPVALHYDLDVEPPIATATAAYFVACEALANVAKHSGATRASARVCRDDQDDLLLEVTDDGQGGAAVLPGHGLAGLRDRLAAMDGRLTIAGPPGTTVTAILPLP